MEPFFIEIKIKNSKWFPCCSYNPNKPQTSSHFQELWNGIDIYCNKYEKILLMGDFNVDFMKAHLHFFCNQCKLKSLSKDPISYKKFSNPSCIDLFLTSFGESFQSSCIVEIFLSNFHKPFVTGLKEKHEQLPQKVI